MESNDKEEILDAEVLEEITTPDYSAAEEYKGPQKKPRGTRKKDFPDFTPETRETILQYVGLGSPPHDAANLAKITPNKLYKWLEKGRICQGKIDDGHEDELSPAELEFATFFTEYSRALSSPIVRLLGIVQKHASTKPYLALKLLEKLSPQYFGERKAIDMNVAGQISQRHFHGVIGAGKVDELEGGEIAKQLSTDELRAIRADIISKKEPKKLPADTKSEVKKDDNGETTDELD